MRREKESYYQIALSEVFATESANNHDKSEAAHCLF